MILGAKCSLNWSNFSARLTFNGSRLVIGRLLKRGRAGGLATVASEHDLAGSDRPASPLLASSSLGVRPSVCLCCSPSFTCSPLFAIFLLTETFVCTLSFPWFLQRF